LSVDHAKEGYDSKRSDDQAAEVSDRRSGPLAGGYSCFQAQGVVALEHDIVLFADILSRYAAEDAKPNGRRIMSNSAQPERKLLQS
jgi:hypothetical protein